MTKAVLALRRSAPGEHELTVTNPDTPESVALPEGGAFAEVMRYINSSDKPPASIDDYKQVGVAKRGLFISHFTDIPFDSSKKYYAWYYVRYQSKTGELGDPSNIVQALVDDSGQALAN